MSRSLLGKFSYKKENPLQALEEEKAGKKKNNRSKYKPFRLWVPKGESRETIILDYNINNMAVVPEHSIKQGNSYIQEVCIADHADCPLCKQASNKNSNVSKRKITRFLTVLDLTPFTSPKGIEYKYSKKLVPITSKDQIIPLNEWLEENPDGFIRGKVVKWVRSEGDKPPSCGLPLIKTKTYTEEELIKRFGHLEVRSQDGSKVFKEENEDIMPYDYDEEFAPKTDDELLETYGGQPTIGSKAFFKQQALQDELDEDDLADDPWETEDDDEIPF